MLNRSPKKGVLETAVTRAYPGLFLTLLFLSGAAVLAEIVASIAFRDWVNLITAQEPTLNQLLFGFTIPILYFASWGLNAAVFRVDIKARYLVTKYAFTHFVADRVNGYIDLHAKTQSGHIMQDIRNASNAVSDIYNMLAFYGFRFFVLLISTTILLGNIAFWSPFVIFIVSAIFLTVSYKQSAVCIDRSKEYIKKQGQTSGDLVEILENIRIVKTFNQESSTMHHITDDMTQEGESRQQLRMSFLRLSVLQIIYKTIIIFILFAIGIASYQNGQINIGSLVMLIPFSITLSSVIGDLSTRMYEVVSNFTQYKQVVKNRERDQKAYDSIYETIQHSESRIEISNLSVYAKDDTILENVNLTFSPHKKAVIMGPSGCGKTTLIECVLGLRAYEGSIKIFTHHADMTQFKIVEVEQNPVHIGDTVEQWLTFGNRNASLDLVKRVLLTCRLDGIIAVGDTGIQLQQGLTLRGLSGGQKQKIAIARAIIAEPDYIVLDEPTSALDETSSAWIMDDIISLGIGIIVVTHDRKQARLFDEVYKFQDKSFRLISNSFLSR